MENKIVYGASRSAQEIRKTCFTIILIYALIFNVPGWIVDIIKAFDVYGDLAFKMLSKTIFDFKFYATAQFIFTRVVAFIILCKWLGDSDINVTSNRIHGHVGFGNYVEIPLSEIKSVSTCLFKKGICISTTGRNFRFYHIDNPLFITRVISDLITNGVRAEEDIRQENFNASSSNSTENS